MDDREISENFEHTHRMLMYILADMDYQYDMTTGELNEIETEENDEPRDKKAEKE